MEIYDLIISKMLIMGLIYFIFNNALGRMKYKIKSIIILVFGIALAIGFYFAYRYDLIHEMYADKEDYFIYVIINIVYSLCFFIYYILIKNPYAMKFSHKTTSKVYYKDYLYIVFKHEDNYLLTKKKEMYSGLNFPIKRTEFHDDVISKIINEAKISNYQIEKIGTYKMTLKKEIHTIYLIDLFENIIYKDFIQINKKEIMNLPMDNFDKEIIFRIIIGESINIEK